VRRDLRERGGLTDFSLFPLPGGKWDCAGARFRFEEEELVGADTGAEGVEVEVEVELDEDEEVEDEVELDEDEEVEDEVDDCPNFLAADSTAIRRDIFGYSTLNACRRSTAELNVLRCSSHGSSFNAALVARNASLISSPSCCAVLTEEDKDEDEDEEELELADAEAEEALRDGPTVWVEVEVIDGWIASVSKGSCLNIILKFGWRMSKMSACSIAYELSRWLSSQFSFCA
jgi:hypothetical protein